MDVSLLYFDGCPNHYVTRELLEALLDEAGWDGTIRLINVDSPERATELEFRGSPTVLINGDDPFLETDAPVGLSCRIYPIDGGFRGTPSEEALRAAIAHGIGDGAPLIGPAAMGVRAGWCGGTGQRTRRG